MAAEMDEAKLLCDTLPYAPLTLVEDALICHDLR